MATAAIRSSSLPLVIFTIPVVRVPGFELDWRQRYCYNMNTVKITMALTSTSALYILCYIYLHNQCMGSHSMYWYHCGQQYRWWPLLCYLHCTLDYHRSLHNTTAASYITSRMFSVLFNLYVFVYVHSNSRNYLHQYACDSSTSVCMWLKYTCLFSHTMSTHYFSWHFKEIENLIWWNSYQVCKNVIYVVFYWNYWWNRQ